MPWPPAGGHQYTRLYEQEGSQQAEKSYSSPLFGTCETESGLLCPVLDSLVKRTLTNCSEFSGGPL